MLSFNTETKTKAPAISLLRAPSRSGFYCRTKNLETAISRSAPFITWAFWQTPAERHSVSADGVARGGNVTWIRERGAAPRRAEPSAGTLVRSAHVCQLRWKPVIGGSSIDYAATELNKGPRPFARTYMCRRVCAASHRRKSAPHRSPLDGTLTRKDVDAGRFVILLSIARSR